MGHPITVATDALTVEEVLQRTFAATGYFNTNIHPADQMFNFVASIRGDAEIARSEYFHSGARLMHVVRKLVEWKFGSFAGVSSFLDFASGYGRLTRFLVQYVPAGMVWVSDIQADAVAFQEEQFGVHGLLSATNPDDLRCAEQFDCIFVASLFTHLPEATFLPWLRKLYSLLKPGGLLIFSAHDETRLDPAYTLPESGLWFLGASEIAELDTRDYGLNFVSEAFVARAIAQATGDRTTYHRIKQGLYHQDIYLVVNTDHPDFSGLRFNHGPGGTLEYCYWIRPDQLAIGGWATDITPGIAIQEIAFFVNGQLRQKCLPFDRRPDISAYFKDDAFLYSGWECTCHVPDGTATDLLVATIKSTDGAEHLLYAGTIGALLLPVGSTAAGSLSLANLEIEAQQLRASLQIERQQLRASLQQAHDHSGVLQAELTHQKAYIGHLETALEGKNAGLSALESYARRLEVDLAAARAPRLPWKRRPPSR